MAHTMTFIHPCEKAKTTMHSRREILGAAAAIATTSTLPTVGFAGPIPDIKGLNPIYDTDHLSAEFNKAYAALRKHLPRLRLMCGNDNAAQAAVNWARNEGQKLPLAAAVIVLWVFHKIKTWCWMCAKCAR